jgi:transposase
MVAELMRLAWSTVGPIVQRVSDETQAASGSLFDRLTCIGIDERSYKKGHKYLRVIVNHTTGKLIGAAPGQGKAVLDPFFALLTEEQRVRIRHITADGARWIAESVAEWCPNVERSIDPFYVVQWATDEVRRRAWREGKAETKSGKAKRERGRPKKGEESEKNNPADTIKGSRYPLSKNPENLG